jgi:hypothetical protein
MNTTTSSKDDAATAPGYESRPQQGHHGVIDGVGTSSSHDDEVNPPGPDIGDPRNLMGTKRFKKMKSVELESQKVQQQLQTLFDFQQTAMNAAIKAGIDSFSTQCQKVLLFVEQLDARFGNTSNSLPANEQTTTPAIHTIKPLMNDVDFSGMA